MANRPEFFTLMVFSISILLKTESFVLDTATIKCLPRSPSCSCGTFQTFENNKEIQASNIYCDETSDVFPDFSVISKPVINGSSWYIGLTKNNFTHIPGGLFIGLTPVNVNETYLYLDLNENHISKIENNAFVGMENIYVEMDLSDNNLSSMPLAFLVLKQLRGISLQFNPIKVIDHIVLQHLAPTLTYYEMGIGNLSTWPADISSFTQVFAVTLFDVQQYKFPQRPFYGSENMIKGMHIHGSDLDTLPCGFTDLSVLDVLTIHQSPNLNATDLVEVCRKNYTLSSTLHEIHLVEGALNEFPDILKYTPMLRKLNLYSNKIRYVNEDFIPLNNVLTDLMLSYNNLQTIPNSFLRFRHLRYLILDNNNIATVLPELERIFQNPYSRLCLRDNPINATALTVKCSLSRDSWARN